MHFVYVKKKPLIYSSTLKKNIKRYSQAVSFSFCVVSWRVYVWSPLYIDKYLSNTDKGRQKMSIVQIFSSQFEVHFII
jgi:hypothetical protein